MKKTLLLFALAAVLGGKLHAQGEITIQASQLTSYFDSGGSEVDCFQQSGNAGYWITPLTAGAFNYYDVNAGTSTTLTTDYTFNGDGSGFYISTDHGLSLAINPSDANYSFNPSDGSYSVFNPAPVPEPSTNAFFFGSIDISTLWTNPAAAFNSATAWTIGAIGVLCVIGWITYAVNHRRGEYSNEVVKGRAMAARYGKR